MTSIHHLRRLSVQNKLHKITNLISTLHLLNITVISLAHLLCGSSSLVMLIIKKHLFLLSPRSRQSNACTGLKILFTTFHLSFASLRPRGLSVFGRPSSIIPSALTFNVVNYSIILKISCFSRISANCFQ